MLDLLAFYILILDTCSESKPLAKSLAAGTMPATTDSVTLCAGKADAHAVPLSS